MEAWRKKYNEERPHTALKNLTPNEYASRAREPAGSRITPGTGVRARPPPPAIPAKHMRDW